MTPSIELRNMAAELHDAATNADDAILKAEDAEASEATMNDLDMASLHAWEVYFAFSDSAGFELVTDASGLFLRCAETGIPLVIGDEYDELETGECVLVKRAA
jgi:hypothetical protein